MRFPQKNLNLNILFIIFSLVLMLTTVTFAIELHKNNNLSSSKIEYYEDKTGKINISDFLSYKIKDSDFKTLSKTSFGLTKSTFWLKISLYDSKPEKYIEIEKPHLSEVYFYSLLPDNKTKEIKTGIKYGFNSRPYSYRTYVFPVTVKYGMNNVFYVKIKTSSYMTIPVKIWDSSDFFQNKINLEILFGMYYGIMLAMIFYNMFLFFTIKNPSYFYYICYLINFMIMQMIWDGFAHQFLWQKNLWWNERSNALFIYITTIFALQFSRKFLNTKKISRKIDILMKTFIYMFLALTVISFIINPAVSANLATISAFIVLIILATILVFLRINKKTVFYFTLAWIFLISGTFINVLAAINILPLNFFTLYSPRLGSIVEMMLLSIALGQEINEVKKEKEIEIWKNNLLSTLNKISNVLTSNISREEIAEKMLANLIEMLEYNGGFFIFINQDSIQNKIYNNVNISFDDNDFKKVFSFISDNKKFLIIDETNKNKPECLKEYKNILYLPVIYQEEVTGIFVLLDIKEKIFTEPKISVLKEVVDYSGIAFKNIELYEKTKLLAESDPLTGVMNRYSFFNKADLFISESFSNGNYVCLTMIDIDNFKDFNDTYGHLIGDIVLKNVAWRISDFFKDSGITARYGGEEFIILFSDTDSERIKTRSSELLDIIGKNSVSYNDLEFTVTVSTGTVWTKNASFSIQELISVADKKLYTAKNSGRNKSEILFLDK